MAKENQNNLTGNPVKKINFKVDSPSLYENKGTPYLANITGSDFGNSKYDFEKPWSVDEIQSDEYKLYRGEAQNGFAQLGLGLLRATGKALLEGVKTPGYLYALGDAMRPGVTLDQALDNSFIKAFEGVEESMKEAMPVYQSYKSGRGGLVDNLFSTSFWGSEGADGVGYMAGLFIPGAGIKALGMAGKIAKLSRGTKILGGAEKIGEMAELGTITLVNTIAEAGAEAKGLADNLKIQFRDRLNPDSPNYNPINPSTGQVWTEKEISEAIADRSRSLFTENFGILLGPNLLMNKFLLGRFAKDKKFLDTFRNANGDLIANPAVKRKLLGEYAKKVGIGLGSEGFFEEGSQFALENYERSKAFNETDKGLLEGYISEYYKGLSNIDGQKSIALGAILGGFGGAIGQFRKSKAESKMRPKISKLIDTNFDGFASDTDIYNRDENGNITGVNAEKQLEYWVNLASEAKASQLMDYATLNDDNVLHDAIENDQFTRFAVPFIELGDVGLEILNEKIDKASQTREIRDNELLGKDKTKFNIDFNEQQWKQNFKDKAKQLAAAYNGSIELANKLPFLEQAAAKDPKYAAQYINVLANLMYKETSKQMFYVQQIEKLNAQILDIDNSDKKFLPQNQIYRNKFAKQVESLNKLLEESKKNYEVLFDEKEQSKAYDEFIKDQKEKENIAQQAQAEVDAVDNEFDPVNNPQGAAKEQAAAASNVAEDLKNEFGNTQTNPPTLNEILNQSQGDRAPAPTLSDVLNQTAQQTPVSTDAKADIEKNYFIVTMSGSRTIEQLKSEKNPDFIGDYEFLDLGDGLVAWKTPKDPKSTIQQYLIADTKSNSKLIHKTSKDVKGNFARINEPNVKADAKSSNDNYELRLNRLNEAISKINNAELAALEGSKPATSVPTTTTTEEDQELVSNTNNNPVLNKPNDDYDNVDKIPLQSISAKINKTWNDFRISLFKRLSIIGKFIFERNEDGLPNLDNKLGVNIKALNELRIGDRVKFELRSIPNIDDNAIAILNAENKLVGWVRSDNTVQKELTELEQKNQLNSEKGQLLQNFKTWRTELLTKLKAGEEVYSTVETKGTGNLYTRLNKDGSVNANINVLTTNRSKDTINNKPIFVYAGAKNSTGKSTLILPETTFSDEEDAAIQKRLDELSKYDLVPGRVFKLVKDLNDQWSLMPIYANNINDNVIKDIIEILKNVDDNAEIKQLSRTLNNYIYTTTNNRRKAPLSIEKDNTGQIVFYIGLKSYTLNDIKNKPAVEFKGLLSKIKQNIVVQNINQTNTQTAYAANNTLLTNVNQFEGEYFVQPFVSFSSEVKINLNPKPVTNSPASNSAQPSTNQNESSINDAIKRGFDKYINEDEEGANSVRPDYSKFNEKQFKAFLKKNLPQLSLADQDQLNALKGLLIDPIGYFKGNLIYLFKGAGNLTAYHEAFHGVFRNLLTVKERENIVNEAKTKYAKPTQEDLDNLQKGLKNQYTTEQLTYLYYEEKLADDFATYINDKNNRSLLKRITDAIRALFDKILSYFNLFESNNTSTINDLFDAVNEGRFKQRQAISNSVVNLPIFNEGAYSPKIKLNMSLRDQVKAITAISDNFIALLNQRLANNQYLNVSKETLFNGIYDEIFNQLIVSLRISENKYLELQSEKGDKHPETINAQKSYGFITRTVAFYADFVNQDVKTYLKERGVLKDLNYDYISIEKRNPEEKTVLIQSDTKLTLPVSEEEEVKYKEGKEGKGYREQTSISGEQTASARIKLFLSAIPVVEQDEQGNLIYQVDDLGLQKYYDFHSLYYYIERNLIDKYTIEDQLATLKTLTNSNPAIISVLNKLEVKPSNMDAEKFQMLINDFKTNFSKQQLIYTLVKYDFNVANNTISFKIIEANRNTLTNKLKEKWKINYLALDKKQKDFINIKNKLTNQIAKLNNQGTLNQNVISDILYNLGIDLSQDTIKVNLDNKLFANAIDIVTSWYLNNENTNYDAQTRIAVENLIKYELATATNMHSESFINGENENIWTIQLPSYLSKFVANIKDKTKRENYINDFFKDVFYENSNLLNQLKDTKFAELFKISYLDSFKDDSNYKDGISFTKLAPRDYLALKIALFNNLEVNNEGRFTMPVNKYLYIVPADKSMQAIVDSTSYDVYFAQNNLDVNSSSDIIDKFYNIFLQEAKRIHKSIQIKNSYLTEGSQSKIKPTLLNEYGIFSKKTFESDLIQGLLNTYNQTGTLSNEQYKQLADNMDGNAFKFNYFNTDTFKLNNQLSKEVKDSLKTSLENSSLDSATLENILKERRNEIKNALSKYVKNNYDNTLAEWESTGIVVKDSKTNEYVSSLIQLPTTTKKTTISITQHIKNLALKYSANYLLHNIELSNIFNGDISQYKPNDLQKRTPQSQAFTTFGNFENEVIRTQVSKDVEHNYSLEKENYDNMRNALKKFLNLSDERIDSILNSYNKTNVTDAQVLISPEFFKRIHEARGTWTPELQKAYNVAEGLEIGSVDDAIGLLSGFKPFYFGKRFDPETKTWYYEQVKCSMFPLFKVYTDMNSLYAQKRAEMQVNNVDMLAFESSFKGAIGYRTDILDVNNVILELDTNNFGIQQENPNHGTDGNDSLRQLKMIMPGTIDTNETYNGRSGEEILDEILSLESANIEDDLKKLTKTLNNPAAESEFNNLISEMITKRGAHETLLKFLSIDDNGQFKYPLDNGVVSTKVQQLISSIYTSRVLKQKFKHGGSLVQATSLGLKFSNLSEQQKNLTPELLAKQRKLEWVKPDIKTGEIGYAECVMPASARQFFDKNGLLKDINSIPDELRQLLAYRIPTEGLHSTMPIKVIEFLPKEIGNFILLPYHVTTQFGADFDFDKIYFFGKEFYTTVDKKTGKTNYIIPKLDLSEDEFSTKKRYNQYVYSILKDDKNKSYYDDVIAEYEQYLGEKIQSLSKNEKIQVLVAEGVLMTEDEFSNLPVEQQNTKAARNNAIVENYLRLLTSGKNLANLIEPSSFKDIVDFKENYFDDTDKGNFFSDVTQNALKNRNHVGRILKGIWALHLTGHSYARLTGLQTKQEMTEAGFFNYDTSVNLEGGIENGNNHRNNFSQLYNDDGKLIAREVGKVMAAVLDDIKNPILESLNINQYTTHALAAILRAGYNMETMLLFSSQPAITKFSKLSRDNSSALKTERFNVKNLKAEYVKLLSDIYSKYEYKDNPEIKNIVDSADKNIPITNRELKYILTTFGNDNKGNLINKVTGKKPTVEDAIKYYQVQINTLKQLENLIVIGEELKKLNDFYTINKEVGPEIENILEKQDILNNLAQKGILQNYEFDGMATLYSTWKSHEAALDYQSKHFPYMSETYVNIKNNVSNTQNNKSFSSIKVEDRKLINNFIRTYLDYSFDEFIGIPTEEQYKQLLRSFPSQVKNIIKGVKGLKEGDVSYKDLSQNLFIANIEVVYNKKIGLNVIKLKSGSLTPTVKDQISKGLLMLYNRRDTRSLAENFVKCSFLTSGFYLGTNMYSQLIDPEITERMGYLNYRQQTTTDIVNNESKLIIDQDRLLDQLVRNYPYKFAKIYDSVVFNESTEAGLPNSLTMNEEALKEINAHNYTVWTDKLDNVMSPRYILVRQKDPKAKKEGLVLYKLKDNTEGLNYVKTTMLGAKGYLIEINPLADIQQSYVKSIDVPDSIIGDLSEEAEKSLEPELQQDIPEYSSELLDQIEGAVISKSNFDFESDVIDKAIAAKSITQPSIQATVNKTKVLEGDIFALPGIPVITTNLGGVHGAGLAQAAKAKGLITQGDGNFKATNTVVQLPVKKKWSDSMAMNNNMELLKESLRSLIKTARDNKSNTYLLPLAGLGHGEGSVENILPLLIKTVQAEDNIKLVLPAENVNLGRQGTVRKDTTRENMPKIKAILKEAGLLSTQPSTQPTAQDNQILNSPQFKEFYTKELESNPNLTVPEALDYYKKCKQ